MASHNQLQTQQAYAPSRRGIANSLRKGKSKVHRNHTPLFSGKAPQGMAAKVIARFKSHDWNRNPDLVDLRRRGYTPYKRIFDKSFKPVPMRISTRSESREALHALSLTLAANADYSPESEHLFEVCVPVEELAKRMGVLHVYQNGRKAYDVLLHALRVVEEIEYVVIHRDYDTDSGQYKPMRIFLTEKFFTSRGISIEEIRNWLHKYRLWAMSNGLAESLHDKYQRHLLRMARMGISLDKHHALRNRLRKIKRWVVSPDLATERRQVINDLGAILDQQATKIRTQKRLNERYKSAWFRFTASGAVTMAMIMSLESAVQAEQGDLKLRDSEAYYRLLLLRAGVM